MFVSADDLWVIVAVQVALLLLRLSGFKFDDSFDSKNCGAFFSAFRSLFRPPIIVVELGLPDSNKTRIFVIVAGVTMQETCITDLSSFRAYQYFKCLLGYITIQQQAIETERVHVCGTEISRAANNATLVRHQCS
jgi:hypothetical protein